MRTASVASPGHDFVCREGFRQALVPYSRALRATRSGGVGALGVLGKVSSQAPLSSRAALSSRAERGIGPLMSVSIRAHSYCNPIPRFARDDPSLGMTLELHPR